MVEQQSLVPWTDLPGKLLKQISKKLRLSDYLNFRLVCTTWREAAKHPRECVPSPLLMLPHCENPNARWFLCPFNGKHCKINRVDFNFQCQCFGSFHGWLLMMEAHSLDKLTDKSRNTMFLINPFTGARIELPRWNGMKHISLVMLSSAPTDPDCIVIIQDAMSCTKFCCIGDEEWTEEELDYSTQALDSLLFEGKIYLLCLRKPMCIRESAINTTTHLRVEVLWLPQHILPVVHLYSCDMVESRGEILLILIKDYNDCFMRDGAELPFMGNDPEMRSRNSNFRLPDMKPTDFLLFRLDLSTSSWVEIKDIGNQVLFLGYNSSRSFSAAELGCKENQIYFINLAPLEEFDTWRVFDMEEGSIRRIDYGLSASDPYLRYGCQYQCNPIWVTPNFDQDVKQGVFAKL